MTPMTTATALGYPTIIDTDQNVTTRSTQIRLDHFKTAFAMVAASIAVAAAIIAALTVTYVDTDRGPSTAVRSTAVTLPNGPGTHTLSLQAPIVAAMPFDGPGSHSLAIPQASPNTSSTFTGPVQHAEIDMAALSTLFAD